MILAQHVLGYTYTMYIPAAGETLQDSAYPTEMMTCCYSYYGNN